jgi:GNAT superfamily N-acetyltransferase
MIGVEVCPFEAHHADIQVELVGRAYANLPESARPKESAAYLKHMQGPSNPAGRSWIAVASEGGRPVGSVGAVPMRLVRRDGHTVTGFQLHRNLVDAAQQGKGIGKALLGELSGALKEREDGFLYGYPNRQAMPVLSRHGYRRAGWTPTRIFLPARGPGRSWDVQEIAREHVPAVLAAIPAPAMPPVGFLRDAAYFEWRFCASEAEGRYRFVHCRDREEGTEFVIVLARHRYAGLWFGVFGDACPDVLGTHLGTAVRASLAVGRKSGSFLLYATASVRPGSRPPWSVAIPESRDPRPVVLLVHEETKAASAEAIAESIVMTADWGGF